jgi:type I restriction enzyme S subunit
MESEWQHLQLGEFVRLQRGHDLTAGERTDGKYPVMGSAGPNGTHTEFKARGPGVVVGRSGASAGRVHYCPVDYWPHNTCLYVTDFLGNDPHFAYYYLGTLRLADYNSGSAQPSLNRNFIYTKPLLVPPPQAQREISHLLGSIDDRIDLLRETNTTLEAIAQALFKSWFVDFDPVRAKAEGREPIAMDAATAALFPSAFEASELGLIPKGWHPSSLGAVCSANGGLIQTGPFGSQLHASDYTADEGVPVVMPQDLASRRISVERISRVAEADAHRLAKHCMSADMQWLLTTTLARCVAPDASSFGRDRSA